MRYSFALLHLFIFVHSSQALISNVVYTGGTDFVTNSTWRDDLVIDGNFNPPLYEELNSINQQSLSTNSYILYDDFITNYTVTNYYELEIPDGYYFSLLAADYEYNESGIVYYNDNSSYLYNRRDVLSLESYIVFDNSDYLYWLSRDYIDSNKNYNSDGYQKIYGPCKIVTIFASQPLYITQNNIGYVFIYDNTTIQYAFTFEFNQTEDSIEEETLELLRIIAGQATTNVTTITSTNTITNAVGYTLSEVADMGLGSQMVSVSNSQALLRFGLDMSDDLTATWQTNAYEIEVEIPTTNDVQFFRLRMD